MKYFVLKFASSGKDGMTFITLIYRTNSMYWDR